MGTGKSFPPSMNDGIHNIPHSGDWIVLNQSTWVTYDNYVKGNTGGGNSGSEAQQPSQGEEPSNPPQSVDTPAAQPVGDPLKQPENQEQTNPPENVEPENPPESTEPLAEPEGQSLLPENRDYIEIPARDAKGQPNMIIIDTGVMTETEKVFYYGIPDDELNMILKDLENIITTAEPGRFAPGLEEQLNELAAINGYESTGECGLLPLYVDGGQERDFTVQMKLVIGEGVLNRTDIYIYRLGADRTLECLGPAEVFTYPDGSVETIQFSTNYVTTYFTSYDGNLNQEGREGEQNDQPQDGAQGNQP